jgi:hypothetical protein
MVIKCRLGELPGEETAPEETFMRIMALVLTGALVFCVAGPASAAKVVTKYGTYEGGCTGGGCLYKPMKAPKTAPIKKHHRAS